MPTVMCWYNNDINEGTLSGHGTTHCTNGVVIQRTVQRNAMYSWHPRGKRTSTFIPHPCTILQYKLVQRSIPVTMAIADKELMFPGCPVSLTEEKLKGTAWCILQCGNDNDDHYLD